MDLHQPGRFLVIFKKCISILLVALALVMVGLVIWGIDKGLDITDESYYLLGMQAGQEKFVGVSAFQLLVISKLFGFLTNIIAVRILSVVLSFLSGLVFSLGLIQLVQFVYRVRLSAIFRGAIAAWLVAVSFFWAAGVPLSFSYNVLINSAMLLITGLTFLLIPIPETDPRSARLMIIAVAMGLVTSVAILVKPSSAILILALNLVLLIIFWFPRNRKWLFIVLGGVAAGLFAGLLFILFGLGALRGFEEFFRNGQIIFDDFAPVAILKRFIVEMGQLSTDLYKYSWLFFVTFFALAFSFIPGVSLRIKRWIQVIFAIWLIAYLMSGSGFYEEAVQYSMSRMPSLGLFLVAIALFLEIILINTLFARNAPGSQVPRIKSWVIQKSALVICLIFLPFATAMGTSNSHLWQGWLHITPWCGLAFLLIQEIEGRPYFQASAWLVLIVLAAWVSGQWINIYLNKPYRLLAHRSQQTENFPIDTPALRGLKVDPPTKKFFTDLNTVLARTQYRPGDEIIAAFNAPGLVLGAGGFSPGNPWITDMGDVSAFFCNEVTYSKLDHSRVIFILNANLPPGLIDCLHKNQIPFPEQFKLVGEVENPYIRRVIQIYSRQ